MQGVTDLARMATEPCELRDIAVGRDLPLWNASRRSVRRNGIPAWNLGFIQQGGGAFRDMGVHVLDSVWSILGHPRPVSASA